MVWVAKGLIWWFRLINTVDLKHCIGGSIGINLFTLISESANNRFGFLTQKVSSCRIVEKMHFAVTIWT